MEIKASAGRLDKGAEAAERLRDRGGEIVGRARRKGASVLEGAKQKGARGLEQLEGAARPSASLGAKLGAVVLAAAGAAVLTRRIPRVEVRDQEREPMSHRDRLSAPNEW